MKRTTHLTAALAIAVVFAAASPALAMRDPGPGGMHGPTPPRLGQTGVGNEYADGMNLYQYCRSNPAALTDPAGTMPVPNWDPGINGPRYDWGPSYPEPQPSRTLEMPSFTLAPGLSGSIAYYAPVLPPVGGIYIKVTGTEKRGTCCQDGRERFYVEHSVSGEGGVYSGSPGFKARLTMPLVEFKKQCPKTEEWQCKGFFKVGVRLSVISGSCTWKYGSGWDCGIGIRLRWADLATARAEVGGGVKCAQTKVSDNPMP